MDLSLVSGLLLGLALGADVFLLVMEFNPTLPVDDAYISFRYARNWIDGHGLVFNPGERVEGFSNFLWIVLLRAVAWGGLTLPTAARLMGAVLTLGLTVLVWRQTHEQLKPATGGSAWVRIVPGFAALAFALLPATMFHTLSGLETPLATLLLVVSVGPVARSPGAMVFGSVASLLLALTRPEGLLVFVSLLVARAVECRAAPPDDRRRLLWWVVPFAVGYAAYTAWRVGYFGELVPNSVRAKGGGPAAAQLAGGGSYLLGFVQTYAPLLPLALWALVADPRPQDRRLGAVAGALVLTAWLGGRGDGYPYARYLFPLVPLLLILSARAGGAALAAALERGRLGTRRALALVVIALAAVSGAALAVPRVTQVVTLLRYGAYFPAQLASFVTPDGAPHRRDDLAQHLGHHALAVWLQSHARSDQLLATSEVGIAPFYSGLRVLDTFGLADRHVASLPGEPGAKADPAYVFGRRPDYLAFRVVRDCFCRGTVADSRLLADWRARSWYDFVRSFRYLDTTILLFRLRAEPAVSVRYDFVEAYSHERVTFVDAAGRERRDAGLAAAATGVTSWGPLASETTVAATVSHLARLESEGAPDFAGAEVMRTWLALARRVLREQPVSGGLRPRIAYRVAVAPGSVLRFGVGTRRDTWTSAPGNGVRFTLFVNDVAVFDRQLDPRSAPSDRAWTDYEVDLGPWAGGEVAIAFVTSAGSRDDPAEEVAGWAEPQLIETRR